MDQQSAKRTPRRFRSPWAVGLAALIAAAVLCVFVFQPFHNPRGNEEDTADTAPPSGLDISEPETEVPQGLPIVPWGKRHHFPEIRKPWYVPAQENASAPGEDEPVLGLVLGKQARAFSTNQLNDHEMVIDEIAGVPVLVTY
jgi:hypothetical protein